jgi:hypothetical protein
MTVDTEKDAFQHAWLASDGRENVFDAGGQRKETER